MADIFNPKLSRAGMQKAGVVDETAGMNYELGADLLKTGVQEFGEYQVRNANEEINKILTEEVAVDAEQEKILSSARDEIDMELMKEQQGLTNAQQKQFNINKVIAKAKGRAPFMSKQLDELEASATGLTGAGKRAANSASELKSQTEIAKTAMMKDRETLSLQMFGKSSTQLTDEQFNVIRGYESTKANNMAREVAIKSRQLAEQETELDDNRRSAITESNKIDLNTMANDSLNSLNVVMNEVLNSPDLTLDGYNQSMALYRGKSQEIIDKLTQEYSKFGIPMDKDIINTFQTRIDNTVKNYEGYKNLTPEIRNELSMNQYLKTAQVEQARTQAGLNNILTTEKRINLMQKKELKSLISDDKGFAEKSAFKYFPDLAGKYVDTATKKFDGQAMFNDLTMVQEYSGKTIERDFGESKAIAMNAAVAKIKNFGLSNTDTNLMIEGENNDPQTDAIVYLNEKQNIRAEDAISYLGKAVAALPYVLSNLKMLTSNNYTPGNPNTEISNYRTEQADQLLQQGASFVTRAIMENPDSIEVVDGNIISNDQDIMRALNEMYAVADKFKNIPNAKEKMISHIVEVQKAAIDSSIINPMIAELDKEIENNYLYSSLTPAEKAELRNEVIRTERTIQSAEGMKSRQAETVQRLANAFGQKGKYNQSATLTSGANLHNLLSGKKLDYTDESFGSKVEGALTSEPVETTDRLRAAAYFGLGTAAQLSKFKNFVSSTGRKLFGDSLEEKLEVEYDKKLGLPRAQAKFVKSVQTKTMDKDKAKKIYDTILPKMEELEERQMLGESLTGKDAELFKYYDKFTSAYDKLYKVGEPVSLANMPNTFDPTAREITERIIAGETQDEAEAAIALEESDELAAQYEADQAGDIYRLTFENEIGRGRTDSRELHLPSETSGITIGPGYDLGLRTADEIIADLTSVGVPQEDATRIAQGAGLKGKEAETFIDENDDIEITDEQERALFGKVVPMYVERAERDYNNFDIEGKPSFDELPETVRQLLVDYSYNAGVSTFPKFFKALVTGDKEEALKQYKRYTGNKPLGRRNKDTLKVLNSYHFADLTQ